MRKLIAALSILLLLVGCSSFNKSQIVDRSNNDKTMACVYNDAVALIFVDTRTGVQYLCLSHGATIMVDRDGKPLIYDGD